MYIRMYIIFETLECEVRSGDGTNNNLFMYYLKILQVCVGLNICNMVLGGVVNEFKVK